jgi:hypothetical protein
MRRVKFLIVILVLSVMMMGIGFAWWNDTLTLAGTAETGSMNVHFEEQEGTVAGDFPSVAGSPYVSASIKSVTAKQITYEVMNLFPSGAGSIKVKVKNDSTIPVKFNRAMISVAGDKAVLKDYLDTKVELYGTDRMTCNISLENLAEALNSLFCGITLNPGEAVYFNITHELDKDAPNETQNKTVTFTLTMDWKQFNQKD